MATVVIGPKPQSLNPRSPNYTLKPQNPNPKPSSRVFVSPKALAFDCLRAGEIGAERSHTETAKFLQASRSQEKTSSLKLRALELYSP